MKLRIASLSLLVLTLTVVPAMAQTVYSNGAINGNQNAWSINFGFVVSNTFDVTTTNTTVTGLNFGVWLSQGDSLTSAELSITSQENGGTIYSDQVVSFSPGTCTLNHYGFNVCNETTSFSGPTLDQGTYWLNLQNATNTLSGEKVYWDQNSGPSSASINSIGTIPSESFTVLGTTGTSTTSSTSTTSATSVPEPSSIMLLGSGILGLASLVRRRLF